MSSASSTPSRLLDVVESGGVSMTVGVVWDRARRIGTFHEDDFGSLHETKGIVSACDSLGHLFEEGRLRQEEQALPR